MSRKNKTLRAFLHQNQNPTIKQAWDTAWKHAQKKFHARSMQDMEKQVADLQAECEELVEALTMARETIAFALRTSAPDYFTTDADIARHVDIQRIDTALSAHREKQGGGKTTNKPEVEERLRTLEKRASEAIAEAYRLRRLWEFSAAMISANEKKIKPRGRDEERLLALAKSADHGMAWSGRTDGWLDAGMGRPAAPEDSAAELEREQGGEA